MGFFDFLGAQDAHEQVYGGGRPHHQVTHELMAGAAGFEAMRMFERHREAQGVPEHHQLVKELLAGFVAAEVEKHFERGVYGHLDREKAQQAAQQQAEALYQQQYGR
jgi:hypothetical protein